MDAELEDEDELKDDELEDEDELEGGDELDDDELEAEEKDRMRGEGLEKGLKPDPKSSRILENDRSQ